MKNKTIKNTIKVMVTTTTKNKTASHKKKGQPTPVVYNRPSVTLSGFAEELRVELRKECNFPAESYIDLVNAAVSIINDYDIYDVQNIASEYGLRRESKKTIRSALAKTMVANLSDKETNYLLGK